MKYFALGIPVGKIKKIGALLHSQNNVQNLEEFNALVRRSIENLVNLDLEVMNAMFYLFVSLAFLVGGSLLVTLWMIIQIIPSVRKA